MKILIGLLLIVGGIVLGLFIGGYLMFFKGIVGIIDGIKADWQATTIAWGLLRILLAGATGWLSALFLIIPGIAFLQD